MDKDAHHDGTHYSNGEDCEEDEEGDERTKISYDKSTENCKITSSASKSKSSGGVRSHQIDYLTHPLDRSIALIFVLTVFFTLLAIVSGVPIVLCLFALLPPTVVLKRLCSCQLPSNPTLVQVAPIDSYWLKSGHITHCLLYVDKGLSVEQLRDVITTRILSRPELNRFKSRLIYKGLSRTPYWQLNTGDTFDSVEDHVIEDEPIANKTSLRLRLLDLMSQNLPTDKPLWQIRWAYANYCNQVILIIRIHQSLYDGVGLISILVQHLSDSPPVTTPIKPRFGGSTLPINIFRAIIVGPLTFFLWLLWGFTRRQNNYLKKANNASNFRSIYWTSIDLPKVYRVKQVTRSSLNDVLLSAVSGAIRTYLTSKADIFNPPDINISIPIDIRPNIQYDPNTAGVNYVLVTSPIPTNTEGAIPRLWEVRHLMEELKTSADTAVMYGAHYLLSHLLPLSLSRFLINLVNRNSSLCVSNIQGPDTALSIGSYRLNKVQYWMSPPPYTSITFNLLSYNGKIYMTISSSSRVISNSKSLAKLFKAQINRLSGLLSRRRVPGEGRRRKRSHIPIDAPIYLNSSPSGATIDLSNKLHEVQFELHQLSEALDNGEPGIVKRFEELKEEFTGLMLQLRRRKSIADHGPNIIINIEDEDDDDIDGELRPPPQRRFSVVSIASRRTSIVSSLPTASRVTPPILSRRAIATSPEPPSSPEVAFKSETEC